MNFMCGLASSSRAVSSVESAPSPPLEMDVPTNSLATVAGTPAPACWVLSNHDRPRHVTRYGGGAVGTRRARAAALLQLALPGAAYLYNGDELGMPDVDLFVRSSGEQRTSNFLLWQSAYAEMVFLDTLWPDFDRRHLWAACEEYASRQRRFGSA